MLERKPELIRSVTKRDALLHKTSFFCLLGFKDSNRLLSFK